MLSKEIEREIMRTFEAAPLQNGFFHPSEEIILKYKYFNTTTENIQVILAILTTITHNDIKDINKVEIAKQYLNHEDLEVRDYAISVFETIVESDNMKDAKETIEILENSGKDSVKYIEDYKRQVIKDIKENIGC